MTREIKFRAWDKKNKGMLETPLKVFDLMHYSVEDELELMQYTGLKDKNGKEIYGGDIVKGDDFQRFSGNPVVRWGDSGSFVLEIDTSKSAYRETLFSFLQGEGHELRHLEIIGNIYENPDLLDNK